MELFKGRRLCLFCFFFLLGALFSVWVADSVLPIVLVGLAVLFILFIVLTFAVKRHRVPLLTVSLCLFSVACSILHSFLWITLPQKRAAEYVGEHAALCYVISEERASEHSSEYVVRILMVDETAVDIPSSLICGFDASLSAGDRVAARVSLRETTERSEERKDGLFLRVYLDNGDDAYVSRAGNDRSFLEILFDKSGFRIASDKIQNRLGERFALLLGEENGALASGFLMGDRSDISTSVTRDFRRSGTSHQMAVSGLHIAVLLGAFELLLRKLRVAKPWRCATVTVLSVAFLFLTGFSLSACRSVLMLYAVYLSYLFYDDNDSLTALFGSISIILLLSPHSVNDLGMWMSFLATLGMLTVYPLVESWIPYPRKGKKLRKKSLLFGRRILMLSLMTVIANLFLLALIWIFFGEISLVAVLGNLLLSPIAYLFLIGTIPVLLFGSVPLFGTAICAVMGWIAKSILAIVSFCSALPSATLSLNYDFAGVIIIAFSIAWAIFLVIRLPKKWLMALPPVAALLAFVICFGIYHGIHRTPMLTYAYENNNELLAVSEGTEASFCLQSCGSTKGYFMVCDEMERTHATEIETLVLTHYHEKDSAMLTLLGERFLVRTLYLPIPQNEEEALLSKELWSIAVDGNTKVCFYEDSEAIPFTDSVRMRTDRANGDTCPPILLSVYSEESAYTYLSPSVYGTEYREKAETQMKHSRAVLFGSHGGEDTQKYHFDLRDAPTLEKVIYTSKEIRENSRCKLGEIFAYIPVQTGSYRVTFSFADRQ